MGAAIALRHTRPHVIYYGPRIFGDRFLDRRAARHKVGLQCVEEKLRAIPALEKIGGDFDVSLRPLYFLTPDNEQQQSEFHQIVRHPTEGRLTGARARRMQHSLRPAAAAGGLGLVSLKNPPDDCKRPLKNSNAPTATASLLAEAGSEARPPLPRGP